MCGICGIRRFDDTAPDERVLAAMNDRLVHRGPDSAGMHVAPGIALAVRRLSIVDLTTGDQPIYNEGRSAVIVHNGEIYNHLELRRRLEAGGHVYRTRSDAESILHAYEEHGVDVVTHLRGMFGFAIWDATTHRLLLARDRLGEKPLYYAERTNELVFASEIKALLQHPGITPDVDEAALDLYLSLNYVPAPYTMFKGIRKVPAGCRLIASGAQVSVEPYWDVTVQSPVVRPDQREAAAELRRRLARAVEERLMADVPLGAYLSGGVDSTVVVGLMSRAMDRPVTTYSVGFGASVGGAAKFDTDAGFAALASRAFRTDHRPVSLSEDDRLAEMVPFVIAQMDEPLANPTALATYLVSRQARADGVKVLLTGDGGDELFAGYERYALDALVSQYQRLPRTLRDGLAPLLGRIGGRAAKLASKAAAASPLERYLGWHTIFSRADKARLLANGPPAEEATVFERVIGTFVRRGESRVFQDRLMTADLKLWVADESNMRVDKSAMAASIETRAPFLSHAVVEFAAGLPFDFKRRRGVSKYLLKQAFADIVPPAIASRPKMGFAVPASGWLRGELRPLAEKMLSAQSLAATGYFRPQVVGEMFSAHVHRRAYYLQQLWSLLTFQIWFFTYIAGREI